uniref:HTH tetR-type domain-containing protein n=1 Tax=Batrachochytrium dendrobatidis (strain JAM81 / FGSC 10211) TaxID=684364 RepID=F4PF54_BATDJ|eukprot:XP_006683235.1 hypothetical protein BATDEDRAFT_28790 [Batrachochytrium dendrobatidis JAM81]
MYLQSKNDDTKWMEISKYKDEEEYQKGMNLINEQEEIQELFEALQSLLSSTLSTKKIPPGNRSASSSSINNRTSDPEWIPIPGTSKDTLIKVALEEFSSKGYKGVNITELANKANMTTGAIYHHFGSKAKLYEVIRTEMEQRIIDRMEGVTSVFDHPNDGLEAALITGLKFAVKMNICRLLGEEMPNEKADKVAAFLSSFNTKKEITFEQGEGLINYLKVTVTSYGVRISTIRFRKKVGQIGVPVKALDKAIHFYQEKLGLSLLFNTESMAFFECNGLRLLLSLPEKEEFADPSSIIYFQVENIKKTYEDLVCKEVTFIDEPHVVAKMRQTETWMVFFKDSENNTHALMSEVPV